MAKLQDLSNIHQLWRHNDVIETFNFKDRQFLKSTHQNTPLCQILPIYVDKQTKWQSIPYFLLWRHNDVIEALNLKIDAIFEEGTSKYPKLPNFVLLPQETAKLPPIP